MTLKIRVNNNILTVTCEAREKFGPGDRFLLGTGGIGFAPAPEFEPFRFRRLLAGRCVSVNKQESSDKYEFRNDNRKSRRTWRRHHSLPLLEQRGLEAIPWTQCVRFVP